MLRALFSTVSKAVIRNGKMKGEHVLISSYSGSIIILDQSRKVWTFDSKPMKPIKNYDSYVTIEYIDSNIALVSTDTKCFVVNKNGTFQIGDWINFCFDPNQHKTWIGIDVINKNTNPDGKVEWYQSRFLSQIDKNLTTKQMLEFLEVLAVEDHKIERWH